MAPLLAKAPVACTAATSRRALPVARPSTPARLQSVRCAAQQGEQQQPQTTNVAPPSTSAPTPAQQAEANKPLILQQGQGTAIVTGAISIIFGVAYLVLVFLLDSRGGEMLPPPPEAFGP